MKLNLKTHIPDYPSRVFAITVVLTFLFTCLVSGTLALYGFCIWLIGAMNPATIITIAECTAFAVLLTVIGFCFKRFLNR